MEIKTVYPHIEKKSLVYRRFFRVVELLILIAAIACPIVNIAVGGKAWSIVVLTCLYMAHTLVIAPDLVEYNRISQSIKFIFLLCVLLLLIDAFLHPGWADFVTSIIICCALVVCGILFFTDFKKQRKNMLPIIWLIVISIIRSIFGICFARGEDQIVFILMCVLSFVLLFLFIITLKKALLRELGYRFHIK